ncbi:MAG: GAF domain-containing protein [Chitinophagaceae bacterium]|nr:MAG: GAF domain-containing protein [Chitinophagaceae bacterium]
MIHAPLPEQENERLEELYRYNILDTPPETDFTEIVELAAYICQVPISHISLIERQRSWHKARIGLGEAETPRHLTFCSHTIRGRDPLIVTDASKDVRFANNPFVEHDPHIRFYAGFPLVTSNGHSIGTLCVVDNIPRSINDQQYKALNMLAKQVIKLLDERIRSR